MVVGEGQRRALHERLGELLGMDGADVLMEYLPPSGWGDVARRSDVDHVERLLRMEMASMETRLTSAIDALGFELRGQVAELRGEIGQLRGEMGQLRGELRGEMARQTRTVIVGMATMTVGMLGALVTTLLAIPR